MSILEHLHTARDIAVSEHDHAMYWAITFAISVHINLNKATIMSDARHTYTCLRAQGRE